MQLAHPKLSTCTRHRKTPRTFLLRWALPSRRLRLVEILSAIVGVVGAIGAIAGIGFWASGEIARVRTAVLTEQPELAGSIGSYTGNGSGLTANIKNSGNVRAHDPVLSFPTMGVAWNQASREKGDWARNKYQFLMPLDYGRPN